MKGKYISIIVGLIIVLSIVIYSVYNNSPEVTSYKRAKEIVLLKGKYPDTIKFLDNKKDVFKDGDIYVVKGEATSNNGFGATVHIDFRIELKQNKGDFDLINADISQR